jgi:predicted HTH transcriptional regulator
MEQNPVITIPEIANQTGRAPRTIERHIQQLKESKQVKRVGSARKGSWQIQKKIINE